MITCTSGQVSHEKNSGWLDYIGDDTTQLFRDYKNPLEESLLSNQYNGKLLKRAMRRSFLQSSVIN